MQSSYDAISCTIDDDGVCWITLNRPDQMNAINQSMQEELAQAVSHAEVRSCVRCLVLTGAGERAFSAGLDIKERAGDSSGLISFSERQQNIHRLHQKIEQFSKPTIAAINGVAAGGGLELALCCDLRIGSTTARLGLPEAKLGAIPSGGGTQRLARLIGESRAKELLFTGDLVTADRGLAVGLLNRVTTPGELLEATRELAALIGKQAPLALQMAKRVVHAGIEVSVEHGLEFERMAAAWLNTTADRNEGFRAFVEKRLPVFIGS